MMEMEERGRRSSTGRILVALGATLGCGWVIRSLGTAGTPRIPPESGRSIALLEKVRIGDTDQWILERSHNTDNPIVLFLHGGPGTSQLTLNRRCTRALEQHFIVVNWDQRGAGKSFDAINDPDRMTIRQFIEDTRELTEYLLAKFGKDRLILVGHSWGSLLGVLTVAKYPELFHCYVGIGQVVSMRDGEAASYAWTLEQANTNGDRAAVHRLVEMGPPPYQGDWQRKTITQRNYLARFGGEVHGSRLGAAPLVLGGVLASREYALRDRINVFRGILGSMRLLWPQMFEIDLRASTTALDVPVVLVEGRHDHESPTHLAEEWFRALHAPAKRLFWFERSGHLPNAEEREMFTTVMTEQVRPYALSGK